MFVPIPQRYKIPILIGLAIALAYVAITAESNWLSAVFAFVGAIFGIFFLDLEYILHVYVVDPGHEKAAQIKDLVNRKKYFALVNFIDQNEYSFGELSIRSVLFQILLAIFTLYFLTTNAFPFIACMTLSMMACLLYYQIIEYDKTRSLSRWFWIYNGELNKQTYLVYMIMMGIALLVEFYFI